MSLRLILVCAIIAILCSSGLAADPPGDIRDLKLRDWEPRSMLVTKATVVEKPRFGVVDAHNHLGGGKGSLSAAVVERYLREMDAAGVRTVVNLDASWGDRL